MICSKLQIICIPRFQIIQILNALNFLQLKQHFGNSLIATECIFHKVKELTGNRLADEHSDYNADPRAVQYNNTII